MSVAFAVAKINGVTVAPMSNIIFLTATSLDGYLADANNSLDWLFAVEGGDDAFAELF